MRHAPAPQPSYRLIPSQFPPIGLFDTVATAADLDAVMELSGWTNDRLVTERVARLPEAEWVYGRANASIVMAAFLHTVGARFNGPDLGAWYAAASVSDGYRRGRTSPAPRGAGAAAAGNAARLSLLCRRGSMAAISTSRDEARDDLMAPQSYAASQVFGEQQRAAGEDGIVYASVRHRGGVNACAYRPSKVLDVTQAEHFEISVETEGRQIEARLLPS